MAQIVYTPLGEMNQLIDFWDQPSDPSPNDGSKQNDLPFASGVWAKIEALWSTSKPTRATEQIISEVSHRFTIRYMPGLKEQMYIIYHHPDNGDMRFDIAQIGDPDFLRQELRILAIARGNAQ